MCTGNVKWWKIKGFSKFHGCSFQICVSLRKNASDKFKQLLKRKLHNMKHCNGEKWGAKKHVLAFSMYRLSRQITFGRNVGSLYSVLWGKTLTENDATWKVDLFSTHRVHLFQKPSQILEMCGNKSICRKTDLTLLIISSAAAKKEWIFVERCWEGQFW